ncbi:MAG: CDP-glucose 4,6-dehydratase [Parcubacteria group bacterium GW2011_GWC1_43_11]|nr:MAG: CDP-glucose 4,6-dehydratase [Parcubacteria group bacterium GW2011_GWC1_43_11]
MNKLFNNIYKGKKVLITGHTGFKGSWLSLWLSKLGARVIGYSMGIPTNPSHFELLHLNIISVFDDILNKERLLKTIETEKPDIVFHLAAQPLVIESYATPAKTLETNIIGTLNVLESCRKTKAVKAIINITSDKCYKNQEWARGYKEDDPMGGYDPYSASKGCAELIAHSYRNSFFNRNEYGNTHNVLLANVRAGNVVGGGDWAKDRLIPDIVKLANVGKCVIVRNPHATRPWQHVLEPLSGYLQLGWKLLEGKKEFSDNWNFGPKDDSSLAVSEIVERTKKHWDAVKYKIEKNASCFHEANFLKLDSTKARTKLKWKNVWDQDKTLEKTINWYKNYYDNKKILSENDLYDYIHDAKLISAGWAKD